MTLRPVGRKIRLLPEEAGLARRLIVACGRCIKDYAGTKELVEVSLASAIRGVAGEKTDDLLRRGLEVDGLDLSAITCSGCGGAFEDSRASCFLTLPCTKELEHA